MNLTLQIDEAIAIHGRKLTTTNVINAGEIVFSMVHDVEINTVRLESNGTRRMFMIYAEGVRQRHPYKVIKTEYGFDIGTITEKVPDLAGKGSIKFADENYYYNLNFKKTQSLTIYSAIEPQHSCTVNFTNTEMPEDYFNFILAAICWYMQLPVKQSEHITPNAFPQKPVILA